MITNKIDQLLANDFNEPEVKKLNGRLYDYINRNSDSLFITIGDSWTYGWRLDEEGDRIDMCYGNIVSDSLGQDFLNLSIPAINNTWMVDKFVQLANSDLGYKNISVFIGLTEFGREINSHYDMSPEIHSLYRKSKSCRDIALALANYNSKRLLDNMHGNIKLTLGCNYISNIYPKELQPYFLPRTWLEILLTQSLRDECLVVGSWVIPKFREILELYNKNNSLEIVNDVTILTKLAQDRLDLIYGTGSNHRTGYGHPNSIGHKKWAEYILSLE